MTRDEAFEKQLKHYDDPNGCARGHKNVKRYVTTKICTQCNTEYTRESRRRNRGETSTLQVTVPTVNLEVLKEVVKSLGGVTK